MGRGVLRRKERTGREAKANREREEIGGEKGKRERGKRWDREEEERLVS